MRTARLRIVLHAPHKSRGFWLQGYVQNKVPSFVLSTTHAWFNSLFSSRHVVGFCGTVDSYSDGDDGDDDNDDGGGDLILFACRAHWLLFIYFPRCRPPTRLSSSLRCP